MLNKRLQLKKLQSDLENSKNLKEDACRIQVSGRLFHVFVEEDSVTIKYKEDMQNTTIELFTKHWLDGKKNATIFAYYALKSFENVGIDNYIPYFHDHEVEDIFKKYMQRPHNK